MVLMVTFHEAFATRRCTQIHSNGERASVDGSPWRGLCGPPPCLAECVPQHPGGEGASISTDASPGPQVPVFYADGLLHWGGCFCLSEGSVSSEGCRLERHSLVPGTSQEGCGAEDSGHPVNLAHYSLLVCILSFSPS